MMMMVTVGFRIFSKVHPLPLQKLAISYRVFTDFELLDFVASRGPKAYAIPSQETTSIGD